MPSVAEALRQHAAGYLRRFGSRVPLGHRKVLSLITRCRTGQLGSVHYHCDGCGRDHWVGRSCGNRHCPTCGHLKTQRWLDKNTQRLLPGVKYFLVTFTVPEELRGVLRDHQAEGYRALFSASADSIRDCGNATKALRGCKLGYFGVLHTWGRDPSVYHPHVHFVVPGGGVKLDDAGEVEGWQSTPRNFLFHHGTLIRMYKAKLADALRASELYDLVPAAAWNKKFVVDIKPVGDGTAVLKYLAPYVHRVAISDHRIASCDEKTVTYRITPSKSRSSKTRTVSGQEFVRSFVQHTLPRGFQKVRHYGWMSANSRIKLGALRWMVWLSLGWTYWLASGHAPQAQSSQKDVRCAHCGCAMRVVAIFTETIVIYPRTLSEYALSYLDSG